MMTTNEDIKTQAPGRATTGATKLHAPSIAPFPGSNNGDGEARKQETISRAINLENGPRPPQIPIPWSGETLPDPATDIANARRFAVRNADRVRFCGARGGWLVFDGRRWTTDTTGRAYGFAKETAIGVLAEAQAAAEDHLRQKLARWAVASHSVSRLDAMLKLAQSEPELVARPEDFDRDPLMLNTPSGTVDLRTGQVHPHDPADMLTRITAAAYRPGATHPVWDRYLADATGGDAELTAYLQRAAGYSLSGLCDEETIFIVLGPEATGKSTLAECLLAALGGYALKVPFDLLLERGRYHVGAPRPDLLQLDGVRLAVAAESAGGRRVDAVLLKELSGRDTIAARALYCAPTTFRPTHKLWLVTNDAPQIPDRDGAIWRRLRRIPFERVVPECKRDPQVKSVLTTDPDALATILAWAVEGHFRWRKEGLGHPEIIREKTSELRSSYDPLASFIVECCVVDPEVMVAASELRATYLQWLSEAGGARCPDKEWAARLEAFGAQRKSLSTSTGKKTVWLGIGLKNSATTIPTGGTTNCIPSLVKSP